MGSKKHQYLLPLACPIFCLGTLLMLTLQIFCHVQGQNILSRRNALEVHFFCRALGAFFAHTLADPFIRSNTIRMEVQEQKRFV